MEQAQRLLENTPSWFKKDATRSEVCVNLRDRGYIGLLGDDFVNFFRTNNEGETQNGWHWVVKTVDEIVNLHAWYRGA